MTRYAIGLGSNQGDRLAHLQAGIRLISELGDVEAVSGLYQTDPIGGPEQGAYLNAVAVLSSPLDPAALLDGLHQIEAGRGRVREEKWGPRTLDLDIVASDVSWAEAPRIPHPRAAEREFVLRPLVEVWAEAEVSPGLTAVRALADLDPQGVELVSQDWLPEMDFRP